MNRKEFIALMAFAIGRDMVDMPVVKVVAAFNDFRHQMMQNYTTRVSEIVDIIIWDAQQDIKLGNSYGVYSKEIMKY